ncbi:fk506-binding nuclear protein [Cyclospora cayetanensis]|uniref:peptidylprolyl isomerase n=1 Tax=Cyclospora cayetanensis TaxID=88456 RepID=A0A1D3D5E2_9EIME|nr:fk506-binding nuclear protein [Cyclospora cayetanensis]
MMQTRKGARAPIAKIGEFRQQLKILVTGCTAAHAEEQGGRACKPVRVPVCLIASVEDVEFWVETPGSPGGWSLQLAGTLVPHRRGGCSCCHDETANCTSREEHLHAKKRRIETDPDEAPALLSPETAKTPSLADQLLGYKASGPQQKPPPLSQQRQQEESEVVRAGDIYRLPSGVEYTVVRASGSTKGLRCSKGCNITIQYRGYLLKTKRGFDKGKLTFCAGTGEVIKGLELGLMGCREGETRKITIPSTLAYGKRGAPPSIPPNADLVFECTCTRIKQ